MSSDDVAIRVENLSKCYQIYERPQDRLKQSIMPRLQRLAGRTPTQYYREFLALNDISFEIRKGETVGIIGRNGSGKSTLLQILVGTLAPTCGSVTIEGRIAALLELGSGFNPEFTGRENVFLNGQILGLTQKEIEDRYEQIAEFADIGEFINQPVKTYSSGMFVRLAFAVQAHIDASIVIIDEALAVGDVFFRQKCYTRLEKLRSSGAAILLVSHAITEIEQYCKRAMLLDHGVSRFIGPSSEAAKHYYLLHQTPTKEAKKPSVAPMPATTIAHIHRGDPIDRPPPEAFIDLSNKSQISNSQARCIGVALCNSAGQPCNSFRQGDLAVFYYEFEVSEDIGVPICGVLIKNDRGTIVHGKNSWQFENDVPASQGAGSKVRCRQEIKLDVGPGEYLFEIGLASVSTSIWASREHISHEELFVHRTRICHIADVGSFSVGLAIINGISVLMHHGLANLPGSMMITVDGVTESMAEFEQPFKNTMPLTMATNTNEAVKPTVFHITHWKAGSQWLYNIIREIDLERIVAPQLDEKQFLESPLVHGAVYPTLYVTKEQFYSVALMGNYRKFIVIRDLRDTLISGYFSIRYSHAVIDNKLARWRERLEFSTIEAGLLMLMAEWLPMSAKIQQSWLEAGEKVIRYEDLLDNDIEILEELLIGHCEMPVTPERLREIVVANRFENLTGGRRPGEENLMAHERKGIAGDWRNYFTSRITEEFNEQYGSILVSAGYALTNLRVT